jgi:hypothetical protein
MTTKRFNEMLAGPLSGGLPMFTVTRLALALRHVVDATGAAGEKALEDCCRARQERDEAHDQYEDEVQGLNEQT